MNVLIDMNLSPRWSTFLNEAGFIATHWVEVGAKDAPDIQIMEYAREHDYVLLTHDLDFSSILAATQGEKPSVIQIRSDDVSPGSIGKFVLACLRELSYEIESGALISLDTRQMRYRLLPMQTKS